MDNKLEMKELKIKAVEYYENNIYVLNTIDNDILNKTSEFPIGSMTKIFTVIAVLLLHQHNKIDIYKNISKYVDKPMNNMSVNNINNIRIIDIINHTSGLKDFHDYINNDINCKCYDETTKIFNCECGGSNQKVF
jgi:hypothetical protein